MDGSMKPAAAILLLSFISTAQHFHLDRVLFFYGKKSFERL